MLHDERHLVPVPFIPKVRILSFFFFFFFFEYPLQSDGINPLRMSNPCAPEQEALITNPLVSCDLGHLT